MATRKTSAWGKFVRATNSRKPIYYLDEAVRLIGKQGTAVDLGCGAGVDARYLAEKGFEVTAIDRDSAAIRSTTALCRGLPVKVRRLDLKDVQLPPESIDLAIAWNSLPFLKKESLKRLLRVIQNALVPGGIFIFSLFGPDDAWARSRSDISFITRASFERLLDRTQFIELRESWREEATALGSLKFWHKVQGIARKR